MSYRTFEITKTDIKGAFDNPEDNPVARAIVRTTRSILPKGDDSEIRCEVYHDDDCCYLVMWGREWSVLPR